MAKQSYGILDGYSGTIGPVIGYRWRGRWCLRSKPRRVHNPQTPAQQEHRMLFRDMVRMASRFTAALRHGLREASMAEGMTEGNLFVKMNKGCFTPQGVDFASLRISAGPVAPVAFTSAAVGADGVLRAEFEKNPLRLRADGGDQVCLYAYCPAVGRGVMSAPVYRRTRRIAMALPDEFGGCEVHFYAFVADAALRTSETLYLNHLLSSGEAPAGDAQEGDAATSSAPVATAETLRHPTPQGHAQADAAAPPGSFLGDFY